MKHIQKTNKKKLTYAACKKVVKVSEGDSFVIAAFESNCDDCRTAVGVAGVNEKMWDGRRIGVNPSLNHVPKPDSDLEPLESIRKRRDGY